MSSITPNSPAAAGSPQPLNLPGSSLQSPAVAKTKSSALETASNYRKKYLSNQQPAVSQPLTGKNIQQLTGEGEKKCKELFNQLRTQKTNDNFRQAELDSLNRKKIACTVITALAIPAMIGLSIGIGTITGGIAVVPIVLTCLGALTFGFKGSIDYRLKAEKVNETWNLSQSENRNEVRTKFENLENGNLSGQLQSDWEKAFPQKKLDPLKVKDSFHRFMARDDIAKEVKRLHLDGQQKNASSYTNLNNLMTVFVNELILTHLEESQVQSNQEISKLDTFIQNNLQNAIEEAETKLPALIQLLDDKRNPSGVQTTKEFDTPRLKEHYTQFEKDFETLAGNAPDQARLDQAFASLEGEIEPLEQSISELQKLKEDLFTPDHNWQADRWDTLEKEKQFAIAKRIESILRPAVETRAAEKDHLEEKRRANKSKLEKLSNKLTNSELDLTDSVEEKQKLQAEITTTQEKLTAKQTELAAHVKRDPLEGFRDAQKVVQIKEDAVHQSKKKKLQLEINSLSSQLEKASENLNANQTKFTDLQSKKESRRTKHNKLTEKMAANVAAQKQAELAFAKLQELDHVVQIEAIRTKLDADIQGAKTSLETASRDFKTANVPILPSPPRFAPTQADFVKKYELKKTPQEDQDNLWEHYKTIAPLYADTKKLHDDIKAESSLEKQEALRDQLTAKEYDIQVQQRILNKNIQLVISRTKGPLASGEMHPALTDAQLKEDKAVDIAHNRVKDAETNESASKERVDDLTLRVATDPTLQADLVAETGKLARLSKVTLEEKRFETNALKKFNELFPPLSVVDSKRRDNT